jgi:hypothetical protein
MGGQNYQGQLRCFRCPNSGRQDASLVRYRASNKFVESLLSTYYKIAADTIRILVATDSHVGYEERDPIRKDDSWRSFDEVMALAKDQDVSLFVVISWQLLT